MSEHSDDNYSDNNADSDSGINNKDVIKMAQETIGTNEQLAESIRSLSGNAHGSWADQTSDITPTVGGVLTSTSEQSESLHRKKNSADSGSKVPQDESILGKYAPTLNLGDTPLFTVPTSDLTKESIRLSKIEGNLTTVQLERKVLSQGLHIVKLEQRINAMSELLRKQGSILSRLDDTIVEQEVKINELSRNKGDILKSLDEKISAMSIDIQKRFDSTLEIHKETPELVERLLAATQRVMSQIPDEFKTQMKEVVMSEEDTERLKEITQITSSLSTPKKKIPKKFRR
jgi:hypothetical protein